jgi:hypothetical protein
MSERKTRQKKQSVQTLENDGAIWTPEVAKTSRVLIGFNIHETRPISEDIELVRMSKVLNRVHLEPTPIYLRRCREVCVEVWIFLESKTSFTLETAEIPQNFLQAWNFTKNLWRMNQILDATVTLMSRAHVSQ